MATKRSGTALRMPKAKMSKPTYKARKQVLAIDALLDVFNFVDRHTLDDANVVSHAYNKIAQRAPPLRIVKDAYFYHNPDGQTFHVTVYYNRATNRGKKNERKALRMVADNVEEATFTFVRSLRFCNVIRRIRLFNLRIQQLFIDELTTVAKQFLCKDEKLDFTNVTLADGVHALDLLLAFPSVRELNHSTHDLLEESVGYNDELLKAVASRGAFYLFTEWPLYDRSFSEAAIRDYMFGDYKDEGEVRKLRLIDPAVSRKFLINLVQACRECRRKVNIDLKITTLDGFDIDESVANGEKHWDDYEEWYAWRFRFDNVPELNIEYQPPNQDPTWTSAELRCWGTIRGSAKGL